MIAVMCPTPGLSLYEKPCPQDYHFMKSPAPEISLMMSPAPGISLMMSPAPGISLCDSDVARQGAGAPSN